MTAAADNLFDDDPPETHPAHTVDIESGAGPTVVFQAVPLDDILAETPHIDFTFKVTADDNDLVISFRAPMSDEDMGAMIDALSAARKDAQRQATLFGWSPPRLAGA